MRKFRKPKLQEIYSPLMRVSIDRNLNKRGNLNKPFLPPLAVYRSPATFCIAVNDLNCTEFDFVCAAYKLGMINKDQKFHELQELNKHNKIQQQIGSSAIWHSLSLSTSNGSIDYNTDFGVSYHKKYYTLGKPKCLVGDMSSFQTNSDFTNKQRKGQRLISAFQQTTAGKETITYYDSLISCVETLLMGLNEYGMDITYTKMWISYPLENIFHANAHIILKMCQFVSKDDACKEIAETWLRNTLMTVLFHLHEQKRLLFAPMSKRPEITREQAKVMFLPQSLVHVQDNGYVFHFHIPTEFVIENFTFISHIFDKFFSKLRRSQKQSNITPQHMRTILQNVQFVIRKFRESSGRALLYFIPEGIAQLFICSGILSYELSGVRQISIQQTASSVKFPYLYDESLSGPEKIFSILIEYILSENYLRQNQYSFSQIVNFFKKNDVETIIRIYHSICFTLNAFINSAETPLANALLMNPDKGRNDLTEIRIEEGMIYLSNSSLIVKENEDTYSFVNAPTTISVFNDSNETEKVKKTNQHPSPSDDIDFLA